MQQIPTQMRRFFTVAILTLAFIQATAVAQLVLSAQAGMVTFSEGPLTVNGMPVEFDVSRGLQLEVGQSFASQTEPAEVLLGIGSFLRLAPHSSLRMLDRTLTHPELALEAGTFLLEVVEPVDDAEIRIRFGHTVTTIDKRGLYRFQLSNAMLMVFGGKATLRSENGKSSLKLGKGDLAAMRLDRSGKLSPHGDFDPSVTDGLLKWSAARSFSLYEQDLTFVANHRDYHPAGNWMVTLHGTLFSNLYLVEMDSEIARKVSRRKDLLFRQHATHPWITMGPPKSQ